MKKKIVLSFLMLSFALLFTSPVWANSPSGNSQTDEKIEMLEKKSV